MLWSTQSPPSKFYGAFEHSLDPKGRITLPSKFRSHFGERCFVTRSQYGDPCAVVWTPEDFANFTNQIQVSAWEDEASRRDLRTFARDAYEVELDKIGRMAIPQSIRAVAGLTKEVWVQGAFGNVELWAPENWQRYSGVTTPEPERDPEESAL